MSTKQMTVDEARLTILMGDLKISPEVLRYRRIPDKDLNEKELNHKLKIMLTLEKYPMDWTKFMKSQEYKRKGPLLSKVRMLIEKVHSLGIYHGDLNSHPGNVVVDPENNRVALIDWGASMLIRDIELDDISDSYDIEFKTVKDVLTFEIDSLDRY